jgi:hypothetical protein
VEPWRWLECNPLSSELTSTFIIGTALLSVIGVIGWMVWRRQQRSRMIPPQSSVIPNDVEISSFHPVVPKWMIVLVIGMFVGAPGILTVTSGGLLAPLVCIVGTASFVLGYYFHVRVDVSPVFHIRPASVQLGDSMHVEWVIRGDVDRLERLHVSLEGREERLGQRGWQNQRVFREVGIIDTFEAAVIRSGTAAPVFPDDTLPTRNSESLFSEMAGLASRRRWLVRIRLQAADYELENRETELIVREPTEQASGGRVG